MGPDREPRPKQQPHKAFESGMSRLDHYARTGEPALFVRELIALIEDEHTPFTNPNPKSILALAAQLDAIGEQGVRNAIRDVPLAAAGPKALLTLANKLKALASKARSKKKFVDELRKLQKSFHQ